MPEEGKREGDEVCITLMSRSMYEEDDKSPGENFIIVGVEFCGVEVDAVVPLL